MNLDLSFTDLRANLKNLGHLWIGYHLNTFLPDTSHPVDKSLNMSHIEGFNVEEASSFLTGEDWQDHERFLVIEEIDRFS